MTNWTRADRVFAIVIALAVFGVIVWAVCGYLYPHTVWTLV